MKTNYSEAADFLELWFSEFTREAAPTMQSGLRLKNFRIMTFIRSLKIKKIQKMKANISIFKLCRIQKHVGVFASFKFE